MNNIDKHITAGMTGLIAALIITSFVLYAAAHSKTEECYVSVKNGNVTHVTVGMYK
jgi:hypothetical protein